MSQSLNKATIIGYVGQDPSFMEGNTDGARLSVATSKSWTDKKSGERRERTEWHRIVVWNTGLVRVVRQYVKKGTRLYIEGELTTRKWQDNEGITRYTTEIVLGPYNAQLILLGGGDRADDDEEPEQEPRRTSDLDDEIPF